MNKKGVIFEIKEFAVYDGPGIRITVFLKGCPLCCNWCHNPEGMKHSPELMISTVKDCPSDIKRIAGKEINSGELAEMLLGYEDFLSKTQGGVTFSGGEPLAQAEFLEAVLQSIPTIHKAIETSGYCNPNTFSRVIGKLDLIIMDLKIMDAGLHKLHTGVSNEVILTNLESLKKAGKPFIIRIPLIPGVSDTSENMEATAKALENAKNLLRVELLPYHKTAGAKYKMLGEEYKPQFDIDRTPAIRTDCFKKCEIQCVVL